MQTERIVGIRKLGVRQTRDIEVGSEKHRFVANGVVVSNSHAMSYSAVTAVEFWLKYHYPTEFITALINNTSASKKKFGKETLVVEYINYARRRGIKVLPPCVNRSGSGFRIEDGAIRYSLGHIKGIGTSAVDIEKGQPYTSFADFYNRVNRRKVNKKVVVSLIATGAFSEFGTRNEVWDEYCAMRNQGDIPDSMTEEEWDLKASKKKTKNDEKLLAELDAHQPESFEAFYEYADKRKFNKRAMLKLIALNAFSEFGTRNEVSKLYCDLRNKEGEPASMTEKGWEQKECEAMNICLSRPPLIDRYREKIKENRWCPISDAPNRKRTYVFGRVEEVVSRTSRRGMPMFVVEISDDTDRLSFYVFDQGRVKFSNELKKGYVAAIPLCKFEDGDARFFDVNRETRVLEK
jgi:DNA polymerase III alpha subunit